MINKHKEWCEEVIKNNADISCVSGSIIENGSINEPHESDTDGCYLCKFGDDFGRDDSDICRTCTLEPHQYYR